LSADNAAAVAQICRRLDGIPLAIEMAAARVPVFTVEELATQLDGAFDRRFQLLTSGARTAPYRHQTLRATLDWSYSLLAPAEQRLLVRLSVFTGGWTAVAAETAVNATLDLLAQLVEKSLVLAEQQAGQTRYRLLETVRQFAAEHIAADEPAYRQTQTQHSRYYLTLLAAQEQQLQAPQQRAALDTLRTDFENIKVAWRWAVEQRDFALLARAIHALFLYCEIRGHFREGVSLFAAAAAELTAAAAASATNPPDLQPLLGRVLARLGACEVLLTSHKSAVNPLEQALRYVTTDWERAFTLAYLGKSAKGRGESPTGQALLRQSLGLSRQGQDPGLMALGLFFLSNSASDYTEAVRACEESLALWRQVGRPDRIADVLGWVAWYICCLGDYAKAIAYWQESIPIYIELGMQSALAWALDSLGFVAWCQGDLATAQSYLQEAAEIYRTIGTPSGVGMCLAELALVLHAGGAVEQAVALARQAVAILRDTENLMMLIVSLYSLGAALISAGDFVAARQALGEACQRALVAEISYFVANTFYYFAELLVLESHDADLPLALEHKSLAVALLSCVRSQSATWQIYKDKAAQLQAEIEDSLPTEMCATAIAHGQNSTLEEMVAIVLGTVAAT
jgi:tetratricopeptide (TPR) repeat protein